MDATNDRPANPFTTNMQQTTKPKPPNGAKRQADEFSTNHQPDKRQKTKLSMQALELTETAFETLRACLSNENEGEELHEQLAARDAEIASLKTQLEYSEKKAGTETQKRGDAEYRLLNAEKAHRKDTEDLGKEKRRLSEQAKANMDKVTTENRQLKARLFAAENDLQSHRSRQAKLIASHQQIVKAARQVKNMSAGIATENMGRLGEALKDLGAAVDRRNRLEH